MTTPKEQVEACYNLANKHFTDSPEWQAHWILTAELIKKHGFNFIWSGPSTRH